MMDCLKFLFLSLHFASWNLEMDQLSRCYGYSSYQVINKKRKIKKEIPQVAQHSKCNEN